MKKITVATITFIVIIVFAVFELNFVSNKCAKLLNSTKQIKNLVIMNDFEKAKNKLKLLHCNYLNDEKNLQMLLLHDDLDTVNKNLKQLKIAINLKNKNRALENIAKIESSCEKIANSKTITLQNIF